MALVSPLCPPKDRNTVICTGGLADGKAQSSKYPGSQAW